MKQTNIDAINPSFFKINGVLKIDFEVFEIIVWLFSRSGTQLAVDTAGGKGPDQGSTTLPHRRSMDGHCACRLWRGGMAFRSTVVLRLFLWVSPVRR